MTDNTKENTSKIRAGIVNVLLIFAGLVLGSLGGSFITLKMGVNRCNVQLQRANAEIHKCQESVDELTATLKDGTQTLHQLNDFLGSRKSKKDRK